MSGGVDNKNPYQKRNNWEVLKTCNQIWTNVRDFDMLIIRIWDGRDQQQEILNRTTIILRFFTFMYNDIAKRLEPKKRWP
jgi:hypothetical protein